MTARGGTLVGRAVATALRVYRRRPLEVAGIAAVVFAPAAFVSTLAASEIDALSRHGASRAVVAAVLLAATALFTIGFATGAGLMDGIVASEFGRADVPLRTAWRRLPKLRLVELDAGVTLLVSVTLLLGVVPGVLAFTFLCVAAPLLVHGDLGVRTAMRRSFAVTHRHFGAVFFTVTLPVLVEHQLLDALELVWDLPFLLSFAIHVALAVTVLATVVLIEISLALTIVHDDLPDRTVPSGQEATHAEQEPVSP